MADPQPPDRPDPRTWRPDTMAVRGGLDRSHFDETAEALYLTSGYVYGSAAEAAAAFSGETPRYTYSRVRNPTVTMLEQRVALLEGAEGAWATATGMAAVFNALAAVLDQGDRVVAARGLFGSCYQILAEILPRWGIHTDFVDGGDLDQWEQALATSAALVFFETPSNPMQDLVDIEAVCQLAHDAGARVVVDNVFATPVFQRPLDLGADIVVYSTTKHMDGQGRTLGGLVVGPRDFLEDELKPMMRHTGPAMSPFNAWVILKSLETLRLRVERQAATALEVATWLQDRPGVTWVRYPTLSSHPQHELAQRQMTGGGSIVTFEVAGGTDRAFEILDALQVIDISNNLGDAKSLVTHPATTTHYRMGAEARAAMGVTDGVIRLSLGLEDPADLLDDLDRALTP